MLYSCIRMATVRLKGLSLSKSVVYIFLHSFAVCITIPATDTNQTRARFCNHLVSSALSSFVVMYKHSSGSKKLSIATITLFDNQYHIDRHVRHPFQFLYIMILLPCNFEISILQYHLTHWSSCASGMLLLTCVAMFTIERHNIARDEHSLQISS